MSSGQKKIITIISILYLVLVFWSVSNLPESFITPSKINQWKEIHHDFSKSRIDSILESRILQIVLYTLFLISLFWFWKVFTIPDWGYLTGVFFLQPLGFWNLAFTGVQYTIFYAIVFIWVLKAYRKNKILGFFLLLGCCYFTNNPYIYAGLFIFIILQGWKQRGGYLCLIIAGLFIYYPLVVIEKSPLIENFIFEKLPVLGLKAFLGVGYSPDYSILKGFILMGILFLGTWLSNFQDKELVFLIIFYPLSSTSTLYEYPLGVLFLPLFVAGISGWFQFLQKKWSVQSGKIFRFCCFLIIGTNLLFWLFIQNLLNSPAKAMDFLVAEDNFKQPGLQLEKAKYYFSLEYYPGAEEILQKMENVILPDNFLYQEYSLLFLETSIRRNNFQNAKKIIRLLTSYKGGNPLVQMIIGSIWLETGNKELFLKKIKLFEKIWGSSYPMHLYSGYANLLFNEWEMSLAHYQDYYSYFKDKKTVLMIARIHFLMGNQKIAENIYFDKDHWEYPRKAIDFFLCGILAEKNENYSEFKDFFKRVEPQLDEEFDKMKEYLEDTWKNGFRIWGPQRNISNLREQLFEYTLFYQILGKHYPDKLEEFRLMLEKRKIQEFKEGYNKVQSLFEKQILQKKSPK